MDGWIEKRTGHSFADFAHAQWQLSLKCAIVRSKIFAPYKPTSKFKMFEHQASMQINNYID